MVLWRGLQRMRIRLDSLGDQQDYLREQLKTVLKKTRILEVYICAPPSVAVVNYIIIIILT